MVALALSFLKANWLPLLIGIVAIGLFTRYEAVRIERDHYESQVAVLKADVADRDATIAAANKQAALDKATAKSIADTLTQQYATVLTKQNELIKANAKLAGDNIAKDKELASIRFSAHAVELLNASIESESAGVSQPSSTTPTAGTTTGSNSSPSDSNSAGASGTVVGQTIVANNANHLACIAQVGAWQKFYHDFQTQYSGLSNATQP